MYNVGICSGSLTLHVAIALMDCDFPKTVSNSMILSYIWSILLLLPSSAFFMFLHVLFSSRITGIFFLSTSVSVMCLWKQTELFPCVISNSTEFLLTGILIYLSKSIYKTIIVQLVFGWLILSTWWGYVSLEVPEICWYMPRYAH